MSRTAALDFQRADFGLFKRLADSPLRGSAEGKRSPGRLDTLQEGNLKGAGAGRTHVQKEGPAGEKTGLAEQRALAGTQETKESLWPLEEGAGNSGGLQGCCEAM